MSTDPAEAPAAHSPLERANSESVKPFARLALVLLVLFIGIGVYGCYSRGIWLDEAWSILEGRRDLSFGEALRQRWLTEISPPFFYMFAWMFQPLAGDGISERRLLNLLPLALAACAFLHMQRKNPDHSIFILLLGLLVISHPAAAASFAEHRAYFVILAGSAVLAAALSLIVLRGTDYASDDRGLLFIAFAGMLCTFSLHYIIALEVGILVAVFIIAMWLAKFRRWAVALGVISFFAGLPILGAFIAQRQLLTVFGDHGWIRTDTTFALLIMALVIGTTFLISGMAAIAALRAMSKGSPSSELKRLGRIMLAALSISMAVLLIANWHQPMIVERYLIAYVPFLMAPIAAFAARTIASDHVLRWAVGFFAAALIIVNGVSVARESRWFGTARMIAEIQKQCPGTITHAVPSWRIREETHPVAPNEIIALRLGLDQVAGRFAFKLQPAESRAISSDCPTILWVEHHLTDVPPAARVVAASGLPVDSRSVSGAVNHAGDGGFITVVPPAGVPTARQ